MQADYDKAWDYLAEGNRLQRDTYTFNPQVQLNPFAELSSFPGLASEGPPQT